MELSAPAAPRLADVVCGTGDGVGKSLVFAVLAAVAGKFAGGDRAARQQSISSSTACLCAGLGLRLSLFQPSRKRSHGCLVGAAAGRNLLSRDISGVVSSRAPQNYACSDATRSDTSRA